MKRPVLMAFLLGISAIWSTGFAQETDLSGLIDRLGSKDTAIQIEAIEALEGMGPQASEAVATLTELLSSDTSEVRAHAAEALGAIGKAASPAAEDLAELVRDDDPSVRREAIEALDSIRPGPKVMLPILSELLSDPDPVVRARVMGALADRGEEVVDALREALGNNETAYWASLILAEIGPDAKEAVPELTELLDDEDEAVRREAILALAAIGPAAAPATDKLASLIDCPVNGIPAIYALGCIGKVSGEINTKLVEKVKGDDPMVRTVSAWALAKLHPGDRRFARRAARQLVATLRSKDPRARLAAAKALKELGASPEIVRPILLKALENADEGTVHMMLDALASLGPEIVPRLIDALQYEGTRPYVCYVLGQLGPAAAPAVPALSEVLNDGDPEVRSEAAFALAEIGPAAADAVPALTEALKTEGPGRFAATYALGNIGSKAISAKPALLAQLESDDEGLVLVSAWALAHIHPECPTCQAKALPALIDELKDESAQFRREAAKGICCFGPVAKDAIGSLKQALNDPDQSVREAAREALDKIQQ